MLIDEEERKTVNEQEMLKAIDGTGDRHAHTLIYKKIAGHQVCFDYFYFYFCHF